MAYQIKDIRSVNLSDYPYYFLDANIWIANLESSSTGRINPQHQPYIDFVNDIITYPQNSNPPKIIVLSLLVSEIFNTYLRNVTMPLYQKANNLSNIRFKQDYRPTTHYKNSFQRLWGDFKALEDYMKLLDDDLTGLNFFQSFDTLPTQNSDFNDYYYFQWAKKHQIPIVTDDADFLFEDVVIITANNKLLRYK